MSKYNEYFSSLGLNEQALEKAEQAVSLFEELYGPYRFETAFISSSETVDTTSSLWFFADDLVGEAKQFLSDDVTFNASVFAKKVTSWELKKENFTINQAATAESALTVIVTSSTGTVNTLIAAGANCTALATILERYILPNMPE